MKNLKRLLTVLVVIAIVATTSIVPVFAEDATTTASDSALSADVSTCATLGVLVGGNDGVTAAYTQTRPDRVQAALVYLRLIGRGEEAEAYAPTENFSDVSKHWGKNICGFLYDNANLGWIGNGDKFYPSNKITVQQYYKVLLVALGYTESSDFEWSNVMSFAAKKGLYALADAGANSSITIDQMATATVEALQCTVNKGTKTLLAKLVEDTKSIDATAAVSTKLYTAPVVVAAAAKVVSATATNLREITVTFDQVLDSTKVVKENFTIDGAAAKSATISADKKSVSLVVADAKTSTANGHDYSVVIKKAVGVAADTTQTVRALDTAVPTVTALTLTGPTSFDISFSEPINTAVNGAVTVNNGIYGASAVQKDDKTVSVTLQATMTAQDYSVKVTGYKDYAGFSIDATTKTLTYKADATALTASITSATQNQVKVKFNKKIGTTLTKSHFYHTFSAWAPDSIATTDNTTYTLTFTTYTIPEGNFNLTVKATDGTTKVTDVWGNNLAADSVIAGSVTADKTAPTVAIKDVPTEDTVRVVYSEAVTGATTASNYVVKKPDGTTISTISVTDDGSNIYKISLGAKMAGGTYSVAISNVKDAALTPNTIAPATLSFDITDKTAPTVTDIKYVNTVAGTDEYLYITFSEAMGTSVTDVANYRLDGNKPKAIAAFGTNKYKLTFADGAVFDTKTFVYGQFTDVAGNKMPDLSVPTALTAAANAEAAPAAANITSITTTSLNTIKIEINKVIPSISAGDIVVANSTNTTSAGLGMISYSNNGTKTTITGTLTANIALADTNQLPDSVTFVAGKLVTDTGISNAADIKILKAAIKDGIAPSITNIAQTGTKEFTVTFDEGVQAVSADLAATDFVVTADGKTLVPGTDYIFAFTNGDAFAKITLVKAVADGKIVTIDTKDAVVYIKDGEAGSTVALNAYGTAKSITVDAIGPVATVPAAGNENGATALVITYADELYNGGAVIANGADVSGLYAYAKVGASTGAITSATYNKTNKTVTFVIAAGAVATDTITVNAAVTDKLGNVVSASNDVATYGGASWSLN